jgi:hypothetical protein
VRALALSLLLIGCPAEPVIEEPPIVDGAFTFGDEVVCSDPVDGWSRFSEEAAERGITGALGGLDQGEVFEGFSSATLHDLDADGDLDLLVGQQLDPPRLWWNDGAGQFTEGALPDAESDDREAYRTAAVDLDGDGLPEVIVHGRTLRVWANLGEQEFDAPADITPEHEGRMATLAVGDPNRDGLLDLLVVTSVDGPGATVGPADVLLPGDGAGGFGAPIEISTANGGVSSLIALFTDRDFDGDQDLLEPTNTFDRLPQRTAFFRNDTAADGALSLIDEAAALSVDRPMAGMGVDSLDLNRDGYLDYCVTDVGPSVCWLSPGDPSEPYIDATLTVGLTPKEPAYGAAVVPTIGWAFDFADLDNDGHPDALHTGAPDNGSNWGDQGYVLWPDLLFAGQPGGTFEDVTEAAGFGDSQANYGLATGDVDGDGAFDVVVTGPGRPVQLYRNRCTTGAWLDVEFDGPPGNREGYGAVVWVEDDRGTQIRELYGVRATGQGPSRLHFGLGESDVHRLTVRWPDGTESSVEDVPTRRVVTVQHR